MTTVKTELFEGTEDVEIIEQEYTGTLYAVGCDHLGCFTIMEVVESSGEPYTDTYQVPDNGDVIQFTPENADLLARALELYGF